MWTGIVRDYGYRGRSHSLWYCDAGEEGHFSWYEMAFMDNPLSGGGGNLKPFALTPGPAGIALSPAIGTKQLARSRRRLVPGELDDFIARWATGWRPRTTDR